MDYNINKNVSFPREYDIVLVGCVPHDHVLLVGDVQEGDQHARRGQPRYVAVAYSDFSLVLHYLVYQLLRLPNVVSPLQDLLALLVCYLQYVFLVCHVQIVRPVHRGMHIVLILVIRISIKHRRIRS